MESICVLFTNDQFRKLGSDSSNINLHDSC